MLAAAVGAQLAEEGTAKPALSGQVGGPANSAATLVLPCDEVTVPAVFAVMVDAIDGGIKRIAAAICMAIEKGAEEDRLTTPALILSDSSRFVRPWTKEGRADTI